MASGYVVKNALEFSKGRLSNLYKTLKCIMK